MMTESQAENKPNSKAKGTSNPSKPRKAATKAKPPSKSDAKAKLGTSDAKPPKLPSASKPAIAKAKAGAPVVAGPKNHERATGEPASRPGDAQIRDLGDWREETLSRMRALILEADPEMIEERKWRKASNSMAGVPVWSHNGIVCTGETYKQVVKLTFARGASLPDPSRLFNSSLEGNTRRAIDIHQGEQVDADAFKSLIEAAVAQNGSPAKKSNNRQG